MASCRAKERTRFALQMLTVVMAGVVVSLVSVAVVPCPSFR